MLNLPWMRHNWSISNLPKANYLIYKERPTKCVYNAGLRMVPTHARWKPSPCIILITEVMAFALLTTTTSDLQATPTPFAQSWNNCSNNSKRSVSSCEASEIAIKCLRLFTSDTAMIKIGILDIWDYALHMYAYTLYEGFIETNFSNLGARSTTLNLTSPHSLGWRKWPASIVEFNVEWLVLSFTHLRMSIDVNPPQLLSFPWI